MMYLEACNLKYDAEQLLNDVAETCIHFRLHYIKVESELGILN